MNFIPYLFKKDFLRIKSLLLVWFLLILAQSALSIGGINLATEFLEFQMFLPLFTKLFSFLQGLMIIVIVPLLIQDDSLVGATAFWFTRPISRKGLLITKSCFIFTLLVALPLIAEMSVLVTNGVTGHRILLAVPEILMEKLVFIIPFLILAILTPQFSKYALVGIIIFAVFAVIVIISSVIMMLLPKTIKIMNIFYNFELIGNPSLEASCRTAKDIYIILIGFILVAHQFLTRYTARTIRWLVVAYLVMMCFTRPWNWDFLKEVPYDKSAVNISQSLSVGFNPEGVIISDEVRFRKKDAREKSISAKETVSGLPAGQFAILKELKDVKMKYADGTTLKSKYVSTSKKEAFSSEKFMPPLEAVLGQIKLLNPFKEQLSYTEIFSLEESDFNQYRNKTGTYLADADFEIYKYEIGSRVPLKQGARDLFGSEQIVIYDILERPNGVSVIIAEKKTNLLFDREVKKKSRYNFARDIYSDYNRVYLIVNKKRNEAFLAEIESNLYADMMAPFGPMRLETKAKQFDFTYVNNRSGPLPKIDKEWLSDAELLRIDAVKIGTQHRTFKIENFSLPSQSTETTQEIDEMDRQLKLQDKQMKKYYPE